MRNRLRGIRLESNAHHQLMLLLQRQHIEEEELRLRHYVELEKFQNNLCLSKYSKFFLNIFIVVKIKTN